MSLSWPSMVFHTNNYIEKLVVTVSTVQSIEISFMAAQSTEALFFNGRENVGKISKTIKDIMPVPVVLHWAPTIPTMTIITWHVTEFLSKNRTGDASKYASNKTRKQTASNKTDRIFKLQNQADFYDGRTARNPPVSGHGADVRKMGIVSEKESIETTKTNTGSINLKGLEGEQNRKPIFQEEEEKHRCGQYTENSTCYSGEPLLNHYNNTVDGRNPAPVDRWFIPLYSHYL